MPYPCRCGAGTPSPPPPTPRDAARPHPSLPASPGAQRTRAGGRAGGRLRGHGASPQTSRPARATTAPAAGPARPPSPF